MANRGDYYIVELERAHLEWGTHRYTDTRDIIYGEGYIQIPARKAYDFNIYNSNGTGGSDVWGENLFRCTSRDGFFEGVLRAQGNQSDDRYAKQFSEDFLTKMVMKTADYDLAIKQGEIEEWSALVQYMFECIKK